MLADFWVVEALEPCHRDGRIYTQEPICPHLQSTPMSVPTSKGCLS